MELKQRIDEEFDASIKQHTAIQEAKETGRHVKLDPKVKIKPT
jgi:hypothetical protein